MKEVHKAATTTGMNLRMLYVGKNNKKEQVQKIIDTIQGEELKIKYWKIPSLEHALFQASTQANRRWGPYDAGNKEASELWQTWWMVSFGKWG